MKPLFILLTAIASFFATSSHASDDVSPAVLSSFNSTFSNAKDIVWSVSQQYYKVTFYQNGQSLTAFYDGAGELAAVTRNLSSIHLPVVLQTELKKKYGNYWISDLFEVSAKSGTNYYVTLENADTKVVLQSDGSIHWLLYNRERK